MTKEEMAEAEEGLRLLKAFSAIKDRAARQALIAFAESYAASSKDKKTNGTRKNKS